MAVYVEGRKTSNLWPKLKYCRTGELFFGELAQVQTFRRFKA
jgi:hypothetical protein